MRALDVNEHLNPALVRVRAVEDGVPVGAGLLFRAGQVITCAHVVNSALGRAPGAVDRPDEPVPVDFPFSARPRRLSARVVRWSPIGEARENDIAVLEVAEVPADCAPVPLVRAHRSYDHDFWVVGFPAGHPDGLVATGKLLGDNAAHWVQMTDFWSGGPRVRRGFSGAPVVDVTAGGVVGIVVAESPQQAEKTAFMIPTRLLLPDPAPDRVVPPVLSFGVVTAGARVEGVLRGVGGPVTGAAVEPGGVVTAAPRDDHLVVSAGADGRGRHAAVVTATTPDGPAEVPVDVEVAGEALDAWPAPDERRVRRLLRGWAEWRRGVPDRLFDGDLVLRDESVFRLEVTRVLELRSVSEEFARLGAGPAPTGPDEWPRVPRAAWATDAVTGVRPGTVAVVTCARCDERHLVACRKCDGRGAVKCPATVTCDVCRGAKTTRSGQERVPCRACLGRGSATCGKCAGVGRRECRDCVAGRTTCPRCAGSGRHVRYEEEHVRREVETHVTHDGSGGGVRVEPKDHVPLALRGPTGLDLVPEGPRERLARWLAARTGPWAEREVLRRVRLSAARVVAVEYGRGATAYVVGDRVVAPGAVWHGLKGLARRG